MEKTAVFDMKNAGRPCDPPRIACDAALTDAIYAVDALKARLHVLYDRIVGADKTNYDPRKPESPHSLYALLNDGPAWITDSCSTSLNTILEIERALYGNNSDVQQ